MDEGLVPLEGCPGETSTRGLEGLASACAEYASAGARFAKWRAALKVGGGCPSEKAIEINAAQLAEYAAICQVGWGSWVAWSRAVLGLGGMQDGCSVKHRVVCLGVRAQ